MKSTLKDRLRNWVEKRGAIAGSTAAALMAAGSFAVPGGLFARWCAVAILVATAPLVWRNGVVLFREPACRRFDRFFFAAEKWWPYLAVSAFTLAALGPVALGDMPVSQDHVNHYFATHILTHDMIPSGRFFGWTDRVGTGYPFGDLYSTPCYLATGLLNLLSFGAIDLQVSYALGIVLVWIIPALAAAAWARRLAGNWAAAMAGIAYVLDAGGDREGGWIYAMFHGVWPQQLGVGVWLFALLSLWRFTEKATTRRLAVSVVLGGFCLWIHPMNSVTLLTAGVLMFAVRLLLAAEESARRGAIRLILALFLAGLIGLLWIVRMIVGGDAVDAYPAFWLPVTTLMARLLDGDLFERQIVFLAGLALIGALRSLRLGDRFGALAVILPAALIAIGSMDLMMGSDLGLLGGEIGFIQYRRFSIAAKPLWYALSGVGFATVVKGIAATSDSAAKRVSVGPAGRLLAAIVLAPFLWGLFLAVPRLAMNPVARALTLKQTGEEKAVASIRNVLEKEKPNCPSSPCRALYWMKSGQGGLYPVIAVADAGFGLYYTLDRLPANNFKWLNSTTQIETMARMGVRIIISRWKQEHALLEKIGSFGEHYLYRIKNASPGRVEINGPGEVKVLAWEPELRKVLVSKAGEDTNLTFLMPPYKKWRATQNGGSLEIVPKVEDDLVLLEVKGARDGEVKLEYTDSAVENAVAGVAVLLILVCAVGIFARPRELPELLSGDRLARVYQWLSIALGALAVAAAALLTFSGKRAAEREWLAGEPDGAEIATVLHRQGPSDVTFSPSRFCVKPFVRDPQWECSERDLEPELTHAHPRYNAVPSCLAVGIPPDGSTKMTFTLPSGVRRIKGRLHQLLGGEVKAQIIQRGGNALGNEPVSIGKAAKSGATFSVEISEGAEEVEFLMKSQVKSRICLEAVAISK